MPWVPLPSATAEESAEIGRKSRKPRLLVDENLGATVALWLSQLGCNARTPDSFGLTSPSDEELFALAWQKKRVLITLDRDFLDDSRFPEHRNPGVIILPDAPRSSVEFARPLVAAIRIIAPQQDVTFKNKVSIATTGEITFRVRNIGTGKIETHRYKFGPKDTLYEWVD